MMATSYAFSFLGYSGFDGGAGSTEGARWDNSVKYTVQVGPAHLGAMYSSGGADTGVLGRAYGIDVGAAAMGVSIDAVYQKENGAVNLRSSFDDLPNPLTTGGLAAYASDDVSWNLMGKYTFDFGAGSSSPGPKLTAFAGYSRIKKEHSSESSGFSQGDYPLSIGINVNDTARYNLEWAGAKFAFPVGWSFTAAYYHANQNSWTIGLGATGTQGIGCIDAGLLCAGSFSEVSFSVDYVFNKHYDLYTGANYSDVTKGLANGFVGTTTGISGSENQTTYMFGGRLKF